MHRLYRQLYQSKYEYESRMRKKCQYHLNEQLSNQACSLFLSILVHYKLSCNSEEISHSTRIESNRIGLYLYPFKCSSNVYEINHQFKETECHDDIVILQHISLLKTRRNDMKKLLITLLEVISINQSYPFRSYRLQIDLYIEMIQKLHINYL